MNNLGSVGKHCTNNKSILTCYFGEVTKETRLSSLVSNDQVITNTMFPLSSMTFIVSPLRFVLLELPSFSLVFTLIFHQNSE